MIQRKLLVALAIVAGLAAGPACSQSAPLMTAPLHTPSPPTAPTAKPPAAVSAPAGQAPLSHAGPDSAEILESLKRDLRITDARSKNWDAFCASVTDGMKAVQSANQGLSAPHTTLDIMQIHQRFLKARAASLDGMITAFKPLYDSFTPEQKANADRLMRQRLGMVM